MLVPVFALSPIDGLGAQLYPGGPHGYAVDLPHGLPEYDGFAPERSPHQQQGRRAPQHRPRSTRFRAGST
jgi:hypothetical protein